MNILLTGANGYIGKRLLRVLLAQGHDVVCCVRDKDRFNIEVQAKERIRVIEIDFLKKGSLNNIPEDIDVAYYLIHSMSGSEKQFDELEEKAAQNFISLTRKLNIKQVIYISGIVNDEVLSRHLKSRKRVEDILSQGNFALTTLRAGIIVGSGSASFEIIRDLVEKLPVMIAPRWLNTRSQPIAIGDVIKYLTGVLLKKETFSKSYDIGGPDILSYKEMLLQFARVRKLKRKIIIVPLMTPRISSYWLYFVTSTSYHLAVNLVNSMKVEVVCRPNELSALLSIEPISFESAVKDAFRMIEQNEIISSWKDALSSGVMNAGLSELINVPAHGCFTSYLKIEVADVPRTMSNLWSIGGEKGWYSSRWLWEIRGLADKMMGGVGLRRGRTHPDRLHAGDALDFWRVLLADRENRRLLLYAEMRLPGEAWLEFRIDDDNTYHQTATFRPKGLRGRIYWLLILPFHNHVFKGMAKKITA